MNILVKHDNKFVVMFLVSENYSLEYLFLFSSHRFNHGRLYGRIFVDKHL